MKRRLWLHEEVLLLELDDEKGTMRSGSLYAQAVGGAVLAELLLAGRIALRDEKKKLVDVQDAQPLGDPLLDWALAEMAAARRARRGSAWVQRIAARRHLKVEIIERLVAEGVLRSERGRALGIFPVTRYPQRDAGPEREVRARLKAAIFTHKREVEPRTIVLVALADASRLLPRLFEKSQLKERKARIKDLTSGQVVRAVTQEAIQALEAAIIVAAVMPAVMAASTAHH